VKNGVNWTLIISIIGAAAWTPFLYETFFKKVSIKGKILSLYQNVGKVAKNEQAQSIYVLKVSLFAKDKPFYLKDIDVLVKFPSAKKHIKGKIYNWRDLKFTFDEDGKKIVKTLDIPNSEYINHFSMLPQDKDITGYLSFSINYTKDEMFEHIKFMFEDYSNHKKELVITHDEIKPNKLIHDDSIWIEKKT